MNRQQAWETVEEHIEAPGLRKHMLCVEAAMRDYAERLGHDPELWGMAGLLHDFDWEIHPTLEQHPKDAGTTQSLIRRAGRNFPPEEFQFL